MAAAGNLELGQLTSKKRVFGEFRDELLQLCARHFWLFLAQRCQRQHNLRKWPQVVAVIGGDLELLDPYFLAAVDSREAEEKLLESGQTPDDVIRRAQAKIGIGGVWRDHQQSFGVLVSFADLLQAVELLLVYLIGFLDDYSRYVVGLEVFRSQTAEHVLEVYRRAVAEYGVPKEMLSDQGRQYSSWRGTTRLEAELRKDRVRHLKSRPHHPMTLGKIERFWKTILVEGVCLPGRDSRCVFAESVGLREHDDAIARS
jgi:transposase InsO family protein